MYLTHEAKNKKAEKESGEASLGENGGFSITNCRK